MNTQAESADYIGPGGWSDPDLLIGPKVYVGGQTDMQARAQFTLWSLFPTNLLISQNVLEWSSYALETYSNAELIAINQDPLGSAAKRIVGGDLVFPCSAVPAQTVASVIAEVCDPADPTQKWAMDKNSGKISSPRHPGAVLDNYMCGSTDGNVVALYADDNGSGECNGKNQVWNTSADGTIKSESNGKCLDVFKWVGPAVDVWECNGGPNQQWTLTANGQLKTTAGPHGPAMCLATKTPASANCTNVWGRELSGKTYALGFVNNGAGSASVVCDTDCFKSLNISAAVASLTVRDLWAHTDVATISRPFTWTSNVTGSGYATAYRLTPT
jgi:alpha-galactosidase